MKRMIFFLLALAVTTTLFAGCGGGPADPGNDGDDRLRVVSTIFPGYDFTRAVAQDAVNLTMLLPPGSESHSFEPTPQDIITIQNCDLFLYVGGDSDVWVDGILDTMDTSHMTILSMMDLVEVVEEEIKEGMEDDDDHGHEHPQSEEIDPDDITARPLSDWAGSWVTIENALAGGDLDAYIERHAAENGAGPDEQKAAYAEQWKSAFGAITVTDSAVTFDNAGAEYRSIGYELVTGDHGASVWYGFEAVDPGAGVPLFIAFSDHGTGHDHDDENIAHFHLRYGDEGFAALVAQETWSPIFFPADATGETIAAAMEDHGHTHSDGEHREYDEHVWTSPANAVRITQAIADALCTLDTGNAERYQTNTADYIVQLEELDASLRTLTQDAARHTLIFGDRFPFRYLVDAYGLDYYAAFPGCSTETEPSAKTVAFLIDKVNEEGIPAVFHIEFSNERMADTICEGTGAKKLLLHSCHNVTKQDFDSGVSYLELMQQNIIQLKEALL